MDVITWIVGNIISGQVTGDTARRLADMFGKIMQDRESMTINSSDTSISKSTQLDYAIPASKIASLSSGEFVGIVADNPDCKIKLKVFHSQIQNDHGAIAKEEAAYKPIPLIRQLTSEDVQENYLKIKSDIQNLFFVELAIINARNQAENDEGEASVIQQVNDILKPNEEETMGRNDTGQSLSL